MGCRKMNPEKENLFCIIIRKIVLVFFFCIILYLLFLSIFSTSMIADTETVFKKTFYLTDSLVLHFISISVIVLIFVIKSKVKINFSADKLKRIIILLYLGIGVSFVLLCKIHPVADQEKLLDIAAQMLNNSNFALELAPMHLENSIITGIKIA